MCVKHVIGLRGIKLQVINNIVRWITVNVMDDFVWIKIASDMLFHEQAVFKNILCSGVLFVGGVWVVVWCYYINISIRPCFTASVPSRRFLFAHTEHRIISTRHAFPVHGIVRSRNIPMIRRIGVSKIAVGNCTANRAKPFSLTAWIYPNILATLKTITRMTANLSRAGAFVRAKMQFYGRVGKILLTAVFTNSIYHRLNCTMGW